MNLIIELSISSLFSIYMLVGMYRNLVLRKDQNGLFLGLISLFSLAFGVYLWIKNGLILDYGTPKEVANFYAAVGFAFGVANILLGLLFIGISILKYLFWRFSK